METIRGFQEEKEIPCPVCGQSTWKKSGQVKDYSVSGEWFELKECPRCSLKATYPQPEPTELGRYYASQDYISHSDTNTGLINKLFHWSRSIMMRRKLHWVTENSRKSKGTLLDVGAGTGYFAKYMQDEGWDVTALEPDSTARRVANEKLGLQIEPLEALASLKENSFDVITLWHVLEHVMDLNGYLPKFFSQ